MWNFYKYGCIVAILSVIGMYMFTIIINAGKKRKNLKKAGYYYLFCFGCLDPYTLIGDKVSIGRSLVFFCVFTLLGMGLSWITVIYYVYKIIRNIKVPRRVKTCIKELHSKSLDKYNVQNLIAEINGYLKRDEFDFSVEELKNVKNIPYNKNMDIEKNMSKDVFISTTRNKICLRINHLQGGGYSTAIYLYKKDGNKILVKLIEYIKTSFLKKGTQKKYFVRGGKVDKNLIKQENYEVNYFIKESDWHNIEDDLIESYINNK